MANDSDPVFRTKVRVKAASQAHDPGSAGAPMAAPVSTLQPRSLMEALRQAGMPPPSTAVEPTGDSRPQTKTTAAPKPRAKRARKAAHQGAATIKARPTLDAEPVGAPKGGAKAVLRGKVTSPGRQAAARLRQLERLKDAAAGLERLARGEVEEATVEIIHHDGRGRTWPPSSRGGQAKRQV